MLCAGVCAAERSSLPRGLSSPSNILKDSLTTVRLQSDYSLTHSYQVLLMLELEDDEDSYLASDPMIFTKVSFA